MFDNFEALLLSAYFYIISFLTYSGNLLTSTFANSVEPDEMQHNAVCKGVCKDEKDIQTKEYNIF